VSVKVCSPCVTVFRLPPIQDRIDPFRRTPRSDSVCVRDSIENGRRDALKRDFGAQVLLAQPVRDRDHVQGRGPTGRQRRPIASISRIGAVCCRKREGLIFPLASPMLFFGYRMTAAWSRSTPPGISGGQRDPLLFFIYPANDFTLAHGKNGSVNKGAASGVSHFGME